MANKRIYQLSNKAATTGRYLMIDVTGLTEAEKILLSELFVLADNDSDDIEEGSTNLFLTTTERSKLSGIANGAEVNVNADWNSVSGDSEILNKPTIPDSLDDLSGDSDDIDEGSTNLFYTTARSNTALKEYITIACSDETTDLEADTGVVEFQMPFPMTLQDVIGTVGTAPTGSSIQVDINKNASSILSTVIEIEASEKTSEDAATQPVISDSALAKGDIITIDRDQVGSSTPGAGLKVQFIGLRS